MATPRVDPFKGFRFRVEIEGIQQAGFSECSSAGSHVEVVEYREGGEVASVRKLPGKISYPDITLKWGTTVSHELYDWHMQAVQGQIQRKTGSVVQLDDTGTEQVRWNFYNAWPSKWDGPAFSAKGNDVSIETLTLSCERLDRA
ncbi:MAG TPA: phage tail protein [Candidatus Solibacter sp.]|nr:phage tail protein [Candidatus Solibacter sp.]